MRVKGQVNILEEIYIHVMTDLLVSRGIDPTDVGMLNSLARGSIREVVPTAVTLEEMVEGLNENLRRDGITENEIIIFDSRVSGLIEMGYAWLRILASAR